MTSKPKLKKVEKSVADKRTPKEYFEEAKAGLLLIAESYEKNALRVDNVLRDYVSINKDAECDFKYAINFAKIKKKTYKEIISRLKKLSFEFVTFESDPFIDMIKYIDNDKIDLTSAFDMYAVFEAVRPFGEKVETLKITIKEMQEE